MQPPVDLTNCDQEPIQWPGFIQPHGYLLALDPKTLTIWQASENVAQLTAQPLEDIIGRPIDQIQLDDLPGPWLKDIVSVAVRSGNPEALSPYPVQLGGQPWLILLHQHDGALILELEPAQQSQGSVSLPLPMLLTQAMSDIQRSKTLAELLHKTAQHVKQITGFDRVMIYRFGEDWHGEVIAEACQEQLEPFLGLHYPASDIPARHGNCTKSIWFAALAMSTSPGFQSYPSSMLAITGRLTLPTPT
ncbi:hypothetical protein [Spirosoma telluris]|uniref:hypothetical protein n=1 Tax=Spirosoma telluris TaxID=2183553 RepID=UPI002FC30E6D